MGHVMIVYTILLVTHFGGLCLLIWRDPAHLNPNKRGTS